jgi:hypothetical protein
MVNLREQAEADLGFTLEGEFGLPVELIDPDGKIIDTDLNGDPLVGQVLYDTVRESPDTGEDIISNEPVVVLRRSSLSRVPQAGEKWLVRIPVSPSTTATKETFVLTKDRPPSGGRSLGFIRLYPTRNVQS